MPRTRWAGSSVACTSAPACVDVVSNKLRVQNIDIHSTHVNILLQWKDPALTLLYEHTYIITVH